MRIPPPLRTSFGNFTTVNSVERITLTGSTSQNTYLWIPWTASPIAALSLTGASGSNPVQYLYNTLAQSPPLMIRPLRSSWSIECVSQALNTAGSIRVYSYDNSILTQFSLSTTATGVCSLTSNADLTFAPLINSAPETEEFPSFGLTSAEHEFVSVPSSYPAYNSYYSFIPLSNTTDVSAVVSSDILNLVSGEVIAPAPFPIAVGTPPINGGFNGSAGLGGLPPMRGFLVELPVVNPVAQTYRICFHRQDGARYPVNTLGATFATNPPKMGAAAEDVFLDLAKVVSQSPSVPQKVDRVSAFTNFANQFNSGLVTAVGVVNAVGSFVNNPVMQVAKSALSTMRYV